MNLLFRSPSEVVQLLCARLRKERLAQQMPQAELAARAGISAGTLSNLEAGRGVALENLVRVALVLGRMQELEGLFQPKLDTLNDMLRYERSANRQRARKKATDA